MATVVERSRDAPAADGGRRRRRPSHGRRLALGLALAEAAAVAVSPLVGFFVLRMRVMAAPQYPDPGIHTMDALDPRDVFLRYSQAYASTQRLRETARAGFLVPARTADLLFGPVAGFYAHRYVLALLAAGAAYLLLRRCYGRLAGLAGIVAVLSSPVLVTAWGTDYPDSAVVSYLLAGLACLAMPSPARSRRAWMAAGAFFLVMSAWAHGTGLLLALPTLAAYLAVRLLRQREGLLLDLSILAAAAALTTGALMVASGVLVGPFDVVTPTVDSLRYLSRPLAIARNHSANPRWAPYVAYLLVLPATVAAFAVASAAGRRRGDEPAAAAARTGRIGTPQLVVGLALTSQLVVCVTMQLVGGLQVLELHFFSSPLWAATVLAFAMALVELADRVGGRFVQALPCAALLAVPLAYALVRPRPPTFGWWPYGWTWAGLTLASVGVACAGGWLRRRSGGYLLAGAGLLGAVLGAFVLTIAVRPYHPVFRGTVDDPPPDYAGALGGDGTAFLDEYRVAVQLPGFVGNATYRGEQLLTWTTRDTTGVEIDALGEYRSTFNLLPSSPPVLTRADRAKLDERKPAELLLLGPSGGWLAPATAALGPYDPTVLRSAALRSGTYVLYVRLLALHAFPPLPPRPRGAPAPCCGWATLPG